MGHQRYGLSGCRKETPSRCSRSDRDKVEDVSVCFCLQMGQIVTHPIHSDNRPNYTERWLVIGDVVLSYDSTRIILDSDEMQRTIMVLSWESSARL